MRVVRSSVVAFAALASIALTSAPPARAEGALEVCLDENIPPLSSKRGKEGRGFDLAVAQAVAERLQRTLAVRWFESEPEEGVDPAEEVNALLSDGLCQLVAGYPLFAGALGGAQSERAKLPDYDGAKPEDRRRWVRLGTLVASRGYRFDPLAVVVGPKLAGRAIGSLGDLDGSRLVAEEGTLADAILMTYGGSRLIPRITHVTPDRDLFERMEQGEHDATLVELHRFDAYRAKQPDTKLSSSGHYHSIGFNSGFAGLASEAPLIAQVNEAIGEMLAKGELPALAKSAGLTYVAPRRPDVVADIPSAALRGD